MPKSLNPVSPRGLAELLYVKSAFQEGKEGNCKSLLWFGLGVTQHPRCLILLIKVNQRAGPNSGKGKLEFISFGKLWQSHAAKKACGWKRL